MKNDLPLFIGLITISRGTFRLSISLLLHYEVIGLVLFLSKSKRGTPRRKENLITKLGRRKQVTEKTHRLRGENSLWIMNSLSQTYLSIWITL